MQAHNKKISDTILKLIVFYIACIFFISSVCTCIVMAANSNTLIPTQNQYFELRAVDIQDVGDAKQVTMQLWAHDLKFKRI